MFILGQSGSPIYNADYIRRIDIDYDCHNTIKVIATDTNDKVHILGEYSCDKLGMFGPVVAHGNIPKFAKFIALLINNCKDNVFIMPEVIDDISEPSCSESKRKINMMELLEHM